MSFSVGPESVFVVGESGGGKSTLGRAITGLLADNARLTGTVQLPGDASGGVPSRTSLREYRRAHLGMLFQDAPGSLVPGTPVGRQLETAYRLRQKCTRDAARSRARAALTKVGLVDIDNIWRSRPNELSGGMCQRVMVSLALAAPALRLVIADECVSSLDTVAAGEILELLIGLQKEARMTMLFISHDMRLAPWFDWVAVICSGRLVEFKRTNEFLAGPESQSGRALLNAARALGHGLGVKSGNGVTTCST